MWKKYGSIELTKPERKHFEEEIDLKVIGEAFLEYL